MSHPKAYAVPPSASAPFPSPGLVLTVAPGEGALLSAREKVRMHIQQGLPKGGIQVVLTAGEYVLPETLCFDERDSGTLDSPIVWRAAEGAEVLISGGSRLSADVFLPLSESDPLFGRLPLPEKTLVADLRSLGIETEAPKGGFGEAYCGADSIAGQNRPGNNRQELFYKEAPLEPVRYPARDYLRTVRSVEEGEKDGTICFGVDDPRVLSWAEPEKTWVQGFFQFDWANALVRVASFDREKGLLATEPVLRFGVRDGMRYYFLNVPEELREAGQYYMEEKTDRLYLIPPSDFGEEPLYLSHTKDALLRFDNTADVSFIGMRFSYARGSGAMIFGGHDVRFLGCTFSNLGYKAVMIGCQTSRKNHFTDRVSNGGYGHKIESCDIINTAFGGVYVAAGDRENLKMSDVEIVNCDFEKFARVGKCYFFAVELSAVGVRVANNRFHDGPHAAIWFDGNENLIEYNEFYDLLKEADDAAAVYCGRDYTLFGNVVRYNFFHDMASVAQTNVSVFGTYCDDNTAGVSYFGNLYYRMQGAHLSHGGQDIRFENNLIAEGTDNSRYSFLHNRYGFPRTLIGEGEHVQIFRNAPTESPVWHARYPHLYEYFTWSPEEQVFPHYCVYRNNAVFRHFPMQFLEGMEDPSRKNIVGNNPVIEEDIGFADEENMDLRLKPDSPVFRLLPDFIPIPFEKIGLYRDTYRK